MHILSLALMLLITQRAETPLLQEPPVLVVTGTAEVVALPDQAVVRLGIVRQAAIADSAQQQANSVAQDILRAVTSAGVPAKDIQTARLILSPVYNSRGGEQRITAYSATNTISIRLDNLGIVGNVIDAGLGAGANQL